MTTPQLSSTKLYGMYYRRQRRETLASKASYGVCMYMYVCVVCVLRRGISPSSIPQSTASIYKDPFRQNNSISSVVVAATSRRRWRRASSDGRSAVQSFFFVVVVVVVFVVVVVVVRC